jgi:DNA-binding MarR family transcriptional regulator
LLYIKILYIKLYVKRVSGYTDGAMARAKTRKPAGTRAQDEGAEPARDEVDGHVASAVAKWPEIEAEVEGIVVRIDKIDRLIDKTATANLARFDLTHEEFKVLISLHDGPKTHGSLSRELVVSTGAMTNRLDKMERTGLVARKPDPSDRRGVLLELTDEGRHRLDDYIALAGRRERELLSALAGDEKRELNRLLRKLLASLQSELGPAPKRRSSAAQLAETD